MSDELFANVVVGSSMYGAEVAGYYRSVSTDNPVVFLHAMDRRLWPGQDMAYASVQPVNSPYFEYSAICRAVSYTDVPTSITVNVSHGVWHSLAEFGILPRTPMTYLGAILHLMEDGGLCHFYVDFGSIQGGGVVGIEWGFAILRSADFVRFSPFTSLAGPYYLATVTATPIWRADVPVELVFRNKWSWKDLWLSGVTAWNIYQDIGLSHTGAAAVTVSGVPSWVDQIWAFAHMKHEWLTVTADLQTTNHIWVSCQSKGNGVLYLDIFNAPRWLQEARVYATPNQMVTTQVRSKPKHISDIGVEVRLEVNPV